MSVSKERRDHLRDRTAHNINGTNCVPINRGELRALLDLADERDRYRALLTVAASVLSEDGDTTEDDARALYKRITFALEGNDGD